MLAALILGCLGALAWAGATLTSAPAAQQLGPLRSSAWLGVTATLVGGSLAAADGPPRVASTDLLVFIGAIAALAMTTIVWARLAGGSDLSIAAPIVATDGALAALGSIALGHRLPPLTYVPLALIVFGVILVSTSAHAAPVERGTLTPRLASGATVCLSLIAAAGFGGLLLLSGQIQGTSALWTATIVRGSATGVIIAICVARGIRLVPSRGLPFACSTGVLDVSALALYLNGARHDPAIAAVAMSQYGGMAAIVTTRRRRQRPGRRQWIGVAALVVGAAGVALAAAH